MNITQQDTKHILDNCSDMMLQDLKSFYKIDRSWLEERLMKLNKKTYGAAPVKEDIDFVIMGEVEENDYRQFYFLIMEKGKTAPHYIEKLERIKFK